MKILTLIFTKIFEKNSYYSLSENRTWRTIDLFMQQIALVILCIRINMDKIIAWKDTINYKLASFIQLNII